jgi:hypothetical protein
MEGVCDISFDKSRGKIWKARDQLAQRGDQFVELGLIGDVQDAIETISRAAVRKAPSASSICVKIARARRNKGRLSSGSKGARATAAQ